MFPKAAVIFGVEILAAFKAAAVRKITSSWKV
jgi:hypothetical protein